jgi:hypothetical protein
MGLSGDAASIGESLTHSMGDNRHFQQGRGTLEILGIEIAAA